MIRVIDYGLGNVQAFLNAYKLLDIDAASAKVPGDLDDATHLILPGVGSFDLAMQLFESSGMRAAVENLVSDVGVPILGVCVGMQILSEYGLENNKTKGLNLIKGKVEKIPVEKEALPNIGWHNIILEKKNSLLFKNIDDKEMLFYFVHSYCFNLDQQEDCSSSIYYEKKLTASVEKDNIFGVQFHPEKSQAGGLKILKNFCNL